MASLVISMILSCLLAYIGCKGLSLFFRRTGDDKYKTLVWAVLQGIIIIYLLDLADLRTLAVIVQFIIIILMICIFIALREPLHMINRTGWSRLWLFVPIVNIAIPYLWARDAKKYYPNQEEAKARLAQEKARKTEKLEARAKKIRSE
jgi:choline-glycine betaine transporter